MIEGLRVVCCCNLISGFFSVLSIVVVFVLKFAVGFS